MEPTRDTIVELRLDARDRGRAIGLGVALLVAGVAFGVLDRVTAYVLAPVGLYTIVSAWRCRLTVDRGAGTVRVVRAATTSIVRIADVESLRVIGGRNVALVVRGRKGPETIATGVPVNGGEQDLARELAAVLGVEPPTAGSSFELSTRGQLLLGALGSVFVYLMLTG
jgi:hypothetical protein